MSPLDVRAHLRKQPHVPIRVHISDGSHYDVNHLENAVVSQREIAIAVSNGTGDDIPQRMVYCDPLHITRIEPLDRSRQQRQGA